MSKKSRRSLWDAPRGRWVGVRGYVHAFPCRIPGTETTAPHISVCTLADDEDCEEYTSGKRRSPTTTSRRCNFSRPRN